MLSQNPGIQHPPTAFPSSGFSYTSFKNSSKLVRHQIPLFCTVDVVCLWAYCYCNQTLLFYRHQAYGYEKVRFSMSKYRFSTEPLKGHVGEIFYLVRTRYELVPNDLSSRAHDIKYLTYMFLQGLRTFLTCPLIGNLEARRPTKQFQRNFITLQQAIVMHYAILVNSVLVMDVAIKLTVLFIAGKCASVGQGPTVRVKHDA